MKIDLTGVNPAEHTEEEIQEASKWVREWEINYKVKLDRIAAKYPDLKSSYMTRDEYYNWFKREGWKG